MAAKTKSEVSKSCKCIKSHCLKLYCVCFSSGYFCDKECGCQGCFNRLDYEDTVEGTREEIAKRNQFAFSSKIQSPTGDQLMPNAGKHRKGCNCKKSMCLRKYCECFQAKVGCSDGCRCEGCKNVHGKKEGNNEYEPFNSKRAFGENNYPPQIHHIQSSTRTTSPDRNEGYLTSIPGRFVLPFRSCTDDMMVGTSRMNPFDQEAYHPNLEFMNPFTPQDHIDASETASMTNLLPLMPLNQQSNPSFVEFIPQMIPFDQQSYANVEYMNPFTPKDHINPCQLTSMIPQMVSLDHQPYPNADQFMNKFTPQDHINGSQLTSMTDHLPQMMSLDQGSYPNFMNPFTPLDHINATQSTSGANLPQVMDWDSNEMLVCNNIPSESSRCSGRSNVSSPDDK